MQEVDFLQAIARSPNDTVLQLAFTDWLEENGDPRGELLRLNREIAPVACEAPLRRKPHEFIAMKRRSQIVAALWPEIWKTAKTRRPSKIIRPLVPVWVCKAIEALESDKVRRQFACDSAERLLHFFETCYPNDSCLREALLVARRFALGDSTCKELAEAAARIRDAKQATHLAAQSSSRRHGIFYSGIDSITQAAASAANWTSRATAETMGRLSLFATSRSSLDGVESYCSFLEGEGFEPIQQAFVPELVWRTYRLSELLAFGQGITPMTSIRMDRRRIFGRD